MTDYRMIEVEETSYLYDERSCSMDPSDISQNMGIAFQTVLDFIAQNGITEVSKPLSVYYTYDEKTMTFQAGFIVPANDAAKAKGEVKAGVLPAGRIRRHYFGCNTPAGQCVFLTQLHYQALRSNSHSGLMA